MTFDFFLAALVMRTGMNDHCPVDRAVDFNRCLKVLYCAGCYVIETNKAAISAIDIWQDYITLTRVESAFRDLKSGLGLRPVYHQNMGRTQAHLFLSVLAYHLLVGMETRLKEKGEHRE